MSHSPLSEAGEEVALRLGQTALRAARRHGTWLRDNADTLRYLINSQTAIDQSFIVSGTRSFASRPPIYRPHSEKFPQYVPDAGELEVAGRRLVRDHELTDQLPRSSNDVLVMADDRERLHIVKPIAGENFERDWFTERPGELAVRELGGYRVINGMFPHLELVPPSALTVIDRHGPAFVQQFVDLKPDVPVEKYRKKQQQAAAAGHFVIGSYDGHYKNARPRITPRPSNESGADMALFDNGFSFPTRSEDLIDQTRKFRIISSFTKEWSGQRMDDDILQSVESFGSARIGSALQDLLGDEAIDLTLARREQLLRHEGIPSDMLHLKHQ